jgi:hypothetical protein
MTASGAARNWPRYDRVLGLLNFVSGRLSRR